MLQCLEGQEENPIETFKILLKDFKLQWNKFTKTNRRRIKSKDLIPLFMSLKTELGKESLFILNWFDKDSERKFHCIKWELKS